MLARHPLQSMLIFYCILLFSRIAVGNSDGCPANFSLLVHHQIQQRLYRQDVLSSHRWAVLSADALLPLLSDSGESSSFDLGRMGGDTATGN